MLERRSGLAALARGAAAILLFLTGLLGFSQRTSAADGNFVNLSTRALVEAGEEVMIGGFIIEGGSRRVLIQARGPELVNEGISNALADPVLTIIQTSEGEPPRTGIDPPIERIVNDNWEENDQGQLISDIWGGDPPLTAGSLSSAAVLTLGPGGYTAKVEGKDGTTGVALVEVFGIDFPETDGNFVNLSTRALVEAGEEVMIGGFIIEGGSRRVLIQARGPELVNEGISNVLADPVLTVIQTSEGEPPRTGIDPPIEIEVNDNWEEDGQGQAISDLWEGSPNLTAGSLSAALVLTLDPGGYTAKVEGKDGTTGVAIVEVYGIDSPGAGNPDFVALEALYNAMDGPNWIRSDNWGTDASLSQWYGVGVDENGRVIELDLTENQLSGPIPPELANLAGLEALNLRINRLSGPIPEELGNLANLETLNLRENQLSGPIPPELGNLTNLEELWLYDNELSGPIPADLGNLSNLQILGLHENQLTGPIPEVLGNLTNLVVLALDSNQLTGLLPADLGSLSNLQILRLHENQLSGPIPEELGQLTNLVTLVLHKNQLSGPIPEDLGNLTKLEGLGLSENQLSEPIPAELGRLTNLVSLGLQENQLNGSIPEGLGSLENLRSLDFSNNNLTGPIPADIGSLANLQILRLQENQLSGSIPEELGSLGNLLLLDLSENQLSGSIPAELINLTDLLILRLDDNQLSGCIPIGLRDIGSSDLSELGLSFCGVSSGPDLVVRLPAVSNNSPGRRAPLTLGATVSNLGGGESAATTLRYYRSTDSTISSSDTEVGTDAVGALAAAGASPESIFLTAPSTAGTYYYGACVDAVPGESDTANNCSSSVRVDVE